MWCEKLVAKLQVGQYSKLNFQEKRFKDKLWYMLKELKSNITNEEVTNVAMLWSYEVLTQLIDGHATCNVLKMR